MSTETARRVTEYLYGDWHGAYGLAPGPGHSRRDRSLSIRPHPSDPNNVIMHSFARDHWQPIKDQLRAAGILPLTGFKRAAPTRDPAAMAVAAAKKVEAEIEHAARIATWRQKARWLWRRGVPVDGSVAERYLREARGVACPLPATLRFLPADPPKYPHPALLAGFGLPTEPEPGVLELLEEAVTGVHLTCLAADGSGKAAVDPVRRIIGVDVREPIVLATLNDSLGLLIGEGIETTFWAHQPTGLGAWAAGTADRMPALAPFVPPLTECVTICVDADEAGRREAKKLANALMARGIETRLAEAGHGV